MVKAEQKGDLVATYKYLRGNCKVDGTRITLVLLSTITRAALAAVTMKWWS